MKIFVTGGTGFVGQVLIRELLNQGFHVRALVRRDGSPVPAPAESVTGDTTSFATLPSAIEGCDALINLVGIIREFPSRHITFERLHVESTANLVRAAQQGGIRRFIQMSANGTREDARTGYHRSKWSAEQHLRQSDLDWTIFRPSLIYGPDDQFVNMLAGMIRRFPVIPVMGNGNYRLQPVPVEAVARSFVQALSRADSHGKTYHCCGPTVLTYDQLLDEIGFALGRNAPVRKIHQPLSLMKPVVSLLQGLAAFPMTRDQLTMLLEENICPGTGWQEEFSLSLSDFSAGIRAYL